MLDLYVLMFALPAVISIILLLASRYVEAYSLRRWVVLGGWYVLAFTLQYFGGSTATWVVGLVLQVGLAVYLIVRLEYAAH